jgi:multimeric flavodoxin WrbA
MNHQQTQISRANRTNYGGLKALLINCTLKRSPEASHTDNLLTVIAEIFGSVGVGVEKIRSTDYRIAPGVYPDMTEHGWPVDDWPQIAPKVFAADILILGTPIWLGEKSSECTKVIERLYGHSGEENDRGQYRFYGRVGGCAITGNEDGVKHCAMNILYSLQHIGYTIPPQADCGWIGEAGPGPSYGDDAEDGGKVGYGNDFTNRNMTFMAWNLLHVARMLKDAGGIPAHGNVRRDWQAGCDPQSPNPDYR